MDNKKLIAFIESIIPLPHEKAVAIASHFEPISIKKHEYFIEQGKSANRYLFLESGFIRAYTLDVDGNEVTTEFYAENGMVFEVNAFFRKTVSRENFQAIEDCKGWFIDFEALQLLFHTVPEFREFGRMILVKGFISFKERSLSLISDIAEQRYESLLKQRPDLFMKVPLKYIASYIGITDTSLSRIRREMLDKS